MMITASGKSAASRMTITRKIIQSSMSSSTVVVQAGMGASSSSSSSASSSSTSVPLNVMARRCKSSSSAFIDFPPLPESVREAVKSSVLDEATRPDSKLWADDSSSSTRHEKINGTAVNGKAAASYINSIVPKDAHVSNHNDRRLNGNNTNARMNGASINDPISSSRLLLLNDPLDEWHLDAKPHRPIHSPLPPGVRPMHDGADPFELSKLDMERLSSDIRNDLIGAEHPVLRKAASYFFEKGQEGGKKVRPMMVLLMSRAILSSATSSSSSSSPLPNHSSIQHGQQQETSWYGFTNIRPDLPAAQRRLAEISEMIHTASLFHDDVIDNADTRRNAPAVHKVFGNKMAILAGDYLLARASIYLARLRDVEVVETMSTIIEHLVRGEVMQLRVPPSGGGGGRNSGSNGTHQHLIYYLRKNFYKTGSLMANSCKSAAILGGYPDEIVSAAYRYGKHVGVAFQLVDDTLDFEGTVSSLGKPALADLNAGLATAPVLFAAEIEKELHPLIERKFREEGDVEVAAELVRRSDGIERTKELARVHAELAVDAVMELEPSPYRDALVHLAYMVVDRTR